MSSASSIFAACLEDEVAGAGATCGLEAFGCFAEGAGCFVLSSTKSICWTSRLCDSTNLVKPVEEIMWDEVGDWAWNAILEALDKAESMTRRTG